MTEIELHPNRKMHWLPLGMPQKKSRTLLVFDTETKPVKDKYNMVRHEPFLICCQLLTLSPDGKSKSRYIIYFTKLNKFHAYLDTLLHTLGHLELIAHNTGFDATVCRIFEWIKTHKMIHDAYNPVYGSYICSFKNDDYKVTLIDNINFFAGKLEKIGEELGIKKLKMPKKDAKLKEWVKYCSRDVEIVTKDLQLLSKVSSQWGAGALTVTRASLAFRVYRNSFLNTTIKLHNNLDVLRKEYRSYYGGRTEAFSKGLMTKQDYYYLDFNSLYPSVMVDGKFSIRYRGKVKNPTYQILVKLSKMFNILAQVTVQVNEPCLPFRDKNGLTFPVGSWKVWLAYPELRYALESGYVSDIHECHVYHREAIFEEFITSLHELKQKAKNKGNTIIATCYKLMLNSLYGKFAQKRKDLVDTGETDDLDYALVNYINMKTGEKYLQRILDHHIFKETNPRVSIFSVPIIAAEVTSLARLKLWKGIKQAKLSNVYYVDTDSIFTNVEGYNRLKPLIKKGKLGALELEGVEQHYKINSEKDYEFGAKKTLKGVPIGAKQLGDNKYSYTRFATQTQVLNSDYFNTVWEGKFKKTLKRNHRKGVLGSNGRSTPWRINNLESL